MHSAFVLLAVTVVGFGIFCSEAGAFKCLGKNVHITDAQKESLKTCHKEWKERHPNATDDDHIWLEPCFWACKFNKFGMIKDNKFDAGVAKTEAAAWFSDIPSDDLDEIKKGIDDCGSKQTETLSTDDSCETYSDLGQCFLMNIVTICSIHEEDEDV